MIEALTGYINIVLSYFYNLVGDYGLAIIMLTALVNVITFPLTRKQLQASKKLQEIQPELKRLQEKYKHDKEKYNQVTMEFMRQNKVNPLGGCLPLLIQFPIIIAVFHLLRDPSIIEQSVEQFNPYFLFFGLDLTKPDPFYILPILASAATFFQQKMVLTDPKQKMMLYIFPVMIMVISVSFPAGLVLYWFTNSLFSVGNNFLMKVTENKAKEKIKIKENRNNELQINKEKIAIDTKDNSLLPEEKVKSSKQVKKKRKKEKISSKKESVAEGPVKKKKTVKAKKKGASKAK